MQPYELKLQSMVAAETVQNKYVPGQTLMSKDGLEMDIDQEEPRTPPVEDAQPHQIRVRRLQKSDKVSDNAEREPIIFNGTKINITGWDSTRKDRGGTRGVSKENSHRRENSQMRQKSSQRKSESSPERPKSSGPGAKGKYASKLTPRRLAE